jgi:outer membrane protein insertion porin family
MKLRFIYFILLSVLTLSPLKSQSINSIEITGSEIFTKAEILQMSGITAGMKYFNGIIDSIKERLAFNYALNGYFNSSFEGTTNFILPDSQKADIFITVDDGEPTYLNNLFFNQADEFDSLKIIPSFKYIQGEIFNTKELQNLILDALTVFENNGYPFAKIRIASVYFFTDSLSASSFADVSVKIIKGDRKRIDKIEITGNSSTEDYVITRELRLERGENYSQEKIEELPDRLNRLRFFEPVGSPGFYINSKNEGVLLIDVKEKQTNNFDGIIGYIPARNESEKGYLTGLVNINLRNLFGTGRAAAVRWQQFDRFSQEMELKYLEPWILNYPFNLSGGFFQRKQDTTYIQRKLEGSVEFLATEIISASLFAASENIIPTLRDDNIFTVYNSHSFTSGVNLKIDNRDDPYSPTEGFFFLNSYSFSRKNIRGPLQFITPGLQRKIYLQRIALDLSGFYELFTRQIIALALHGRELRGTFFEESDLFRLGGTNSLRGYREDQFHASRIFWSNLEYRLLLTRRTFAFLFFDTGYYLRKEEPDRNILKQEDFNIGYGLGLNIETGLGVLGVSFALAGGDSFTDGKIHFGLINEF